VKNSFLLFETILSLSTLCIILASLLKYNNTNQKNINIQNIKNIFLVKDLNHLQTSNYKIDYTIASSINNTLNINIKNQGNNIKYIYNKNSIILEKYNIDKNNIKINSKKFL
jgi:hypothetical protein